jgi:hypothetical protein
MNAYATHLEALDQKAGRTHTVDDWRRVGEKSQSTPQALTDDDLIILAYFDGEKAMANARARRAAAVAPNPPSLPAQSTTPVNTKSAEPAAPAAAVTPSETAAEFLKRCGIPDINTDGVTYDGKAFNAAHARYFHDPKALTIDDIKQFTLVDPKFGQMARAKQLGFTPVFTEQEHQVLKLKLSHKYHVRWVNDWLGPILATYRHKAHVAQTRLDALEQRNRELSDRVLMLEARAAAHEAVTSDR